MNESLKKAQPRLEQVAQETEHTNAELAKVVEAATAELSEAVRKIKAEQTNTVRAIRAETAKAEEARTNAMQAARKAQEQAAAAKRELEAAQKELQLLKAARTNVAVATQLQREFLFRVVRELSQRGMVVQSLNDGRTTNRFMAFTADGEKLTLGGPMTTPDDELLVQHEEQLTVLLDVIDRCRAKRWKVREFKVIPSLRYGAVLSDQNLTILWPGTKTAFSHQRPTAATNQP